MMGTGLRLLLFVAALFTLITFIQKIRKNRVLIEDAVFWTLLSVGLLLISIFPSVVIIISKLLDIQSPANLVYPSAIAVLLFRLFTVTIKLSKMDQQIATLTQHVAIYEKEQADRQKSDDRNPPSSD